MRVVFLGSPPFATPVFERLIRSRHRPLALVTAPDRPRGRGREIEKSELVLAAERAGVDVMQPSDPHSDPSLAALRELAPQALLVASYGVIMKPALLELAPHGALNVHGSLLPRHRGASPVQAAILAGDHVTGVSIQRIVRALDEGDVLLAKEHAIGPNETAGELTRALAELGADAAVEALDLLESGRAVFTPQDHARATYARKLKKEQGALDWAKSSNELARFVRAMNPWPGAQCVSSKGRELVVLNARSLDSHATVAPGTVLETERRFVVATGDGALELVEVLPAGKRAMSGVEYMRGARTMPGDQFSTERGT